ncbi:MAG TPA: OmpA family protein [Methylocystis sp.]|nr:OmpA family protein [Methylocystis sp.]
MDYPLSHFGPWLAAVFTIGALTGLMRRRAEADGGLSPWLAWGLLAFLIGLVVAGVAALQGRAGLWLDSGLAAYAAFLLGAVVGALGRGGRLSEHREWALGLLPATLVWIGAATVEIPKIETSLKASIGAALARAGAQSLAFLVEGQDVALDRDNPASAGLRPAVASLDGVRLVGLGEVALRGEAAAQTPASRATPETPAALEEPSRMTASPPGWVDPVTAAKRAADAAGPRAEFLEDARRQADKLARGRAPSGTDAANMAGGDRTGSIAPAAQGLTPEQRGARLEAARDYLAKLPAAGPLELPACQAALNATQTVSKAPFASGSAEITRAAAGSLDALTSILRRCPDARVEIAGHTDNVGDEASNQALSQQRAEAIRRYLMLKGVPAARLSAVGYGSKQPIAQNDDEAGRADNRRIEFLLK